MLMQKIRDNASWVVLVAVVCFVALIMVDWGMSPGNSMSQKTIVGKAEGESIRFEELDKYVQQQATQATQAGRELSAEDYAKMRREIFDELIRQRIVGKIFTAYKLQGSPEEVLDFLKRNPPPGAEKAPIFMGPDSQFSKDRYEKWLADPRIYADPYMRMMEQEVTNSRLPEQDLQLLVQAGISSSSLEMSFHTRREQTRWWGVAVAALSDSFPVDSISKADIQKYFEANPDSFYVPKDMARIPYVFIPRAASHNDSVQVRNFADTLLARAHAGESFDTLAKDYSEDPGSASHFGSLGGFQRRTQWVPAFGEAVAKLQPGQISAPVQSQFGWHLIRLNGSKVEGKDTLYDVSHILLQIAPSPDAIEAIKARLEAIAVKVKAGADFGATTKAAGLDIDSTSVVKGDIGNTRHGAVTGLSSWAFRGQKDEQVSEPLDNAAGLFLAGPARIVKSGRDLEIATNRIRHSLQTIHRQQAAVKWLGEKAAAIAACDTNTVCINAIGKVVGTVITDRPPESYVSGYGFAMPEFYLSWVQAAAKTKTWTKPIATMAGAGILRLDSVTTPTDAAIDQSTKDIALRQVVAQRRQQAGYPDWIAARRKSAKVEDNLDRFYRD